jgi:hypothetical protein
MSYILIAYKSSSVDHCRGCVMRHFSSDCEVYCFEDKNQLNECLDKYRDINKNRKANEEEYLFTLIKGGELISQFSDVILEL